MRQVCWPFDDDRSRGNPMIEELSTHRHRGFDFYLITQQTAKTAYDYSLGAFALACNYALGWYTKIYQYGQFGATT